MKHNQEIIVLNVLPELFEKKGENTLNDISQSKRLELRKKLGSEDKTCANAASSIHNLRGRDRWFIATLKETTVLCNSHLMSFCRK